MPNPDWKTLTDSDRFKIVGPMLESKSTYSDIAGQFENATRNSVAGFISRRSDLFRPGRAEPKAKAEKPAKPKVERRAKPAPKPAPPPPAPAPVPPRPVTPPQPRPEGVRPFLSAGDGCRWPLWDRLPANQREWLVCGSEAVPGRSYCAHHVGLSEGKGTPSEQSAVRDAKRAAAK